MKILFTGGVPDWATEKLKNEGYEVISVPADAYVKEDDFCKGIQDVDVYVSGGLETCSKAVIEAANKLKAIIFLGVDYINYIDAQAANENNIPIYNTPGANARAVAELTLFLMLSAARKAATMLDNVQNKNWKAETGFELQGKTLGLIGSGAIAQNVAEIANGFGMKVLYWSRSGEKNNMNGQYIDLDSVFSQSDIISLHVPKVAGTIIDEKALTQMKKDIIIVNTSPAVLFDADALHKFLSNDSNSCAAFDCFYAEGEDAWKCPEVKLLELPNDRFFITPHAAWRTNEADNNMFATALDTIQKMKAQ